MPVRKRERQSDLQLNSLRSPHRGWVAERNKHNVHSATSGGVQAPDCGAPASPSGFPTGLILLSVDGPDASYQCAPSAGLSYQQPSSRKSSYMITSGQRNTEKSRRRPLSAREARAAGVPGGQRVLYSFHSGYPYSFVKRSAGSSRSFAGNVAEFQTGSTSLSTSRTVGAKGVEKTPQVSVHRAAAPLKWELPWLRLWQQWHRPPRGRYILP